MSQAPAALHHVFPEALHPSRQILLQRKTTIACREDIQGVNMFRFVGCYHLYPSNSKWSGLTWSPYSINPSILSPCSTRQALQRQWEWQLYWSRHLPMQQSLPLKIKPVIILPRQTLADRILSSTSLRILPQLTSSRPSWNMLESQEYPL